MKYIKTLLNLKPLTHINIHNLIKHVHSIELEIEDHISYNSNNYVIKDENIYAYHIEEISIYEYIYNEDEHKLLIMIDKRHDNFINIIDDLIDKGYIDDSSLLYPNHDALYLDEYVDFHDIQSDLPIIYLNNQFNDEDFITQLTQKVKSMAYVIYGSDAFYEHAPSKSMIIFKHNEVLPFTSFHKETKDQLIERLFTKIQNYMCKYEYQSIYSMNYLYHTAMEKMIENTKHKESMLEMTLEEKLLFLEIEKEDYLNKIYKLQNDILVIESQIENYQLMLKQTDEKPILYKGKIKEFYEDEQKDIVLYLIKKKLETTSSIDTKEQLLSIIEDNPSLNLREEKLEEIQRLLKASKKMTERLMEDLKPHGPTFLRHSNNHYFFNFYNDSRYLIDIASSPGDVYWSKQVYRAFKRHCF